jgi:glutamyl-tRNAGlu reductase-like protein
MSIATDAVREHADRIAGEALARARGRLQMLSPEQQRAVEELSHAVAHGIARLLREECKRHLELATIHESEA